MCTKQPPWEKNLFSYLRREVRIIIIELHSPNVLTGKLLLCFMTLSSNQPSATEVSAQLHESAGETSVTVPKTQKISLYLTFGETLSVLEKLPPWQLLILIQQVPSVKADPRRQKRSAFFKLDSSVINEPCWFLVCLGFVMFWLVFGFLF